MFAKHPLVSKLVVTGLLVFLLFIPLTLIHGVIAERAGYRAGAVEEVSRAHAGAQTVTGPVLQVPWVEAYTAQVPVEGRSGQTVTERRSTEGVALQFPDSLHVEAELTTETRHRGLFPVTVYVSRQRISGRIVVPPVEPTAKDGQVALRPQSLLLGVSDLRGLRSAPRLTIAGREIPVTPARAGDRLPLRAQLPADLATVGAELDFRLELELAGTARIKWTPLAGENTVHLTSPWPHPGFGGEFLPRERKVSDAGFEATWSVPSLSTLAQRQFLAQGGPGRDVDAFGVDLAAPIDVYRLSERAAKYGSMFVLLTFAVFFVVEVLGRSRMHPMQYLMVGMALVLFFLLLLSLGEHLPFPIAYAVSAAACVTLIAHYLQRAMRSRGAAAGVGGMLAALYGVLYGILISEDNALMLGSLLLFGVLAVVMVATRELDWHDALPGGDAPAEPARG